jgi:hypothetical protein
MSLTEKLPNLRDTAQLSAGDSVDKKPKRKIHRRPDQKSESARKYTPHWWS